MYLQCIYPKEFKVYIKQTVMRINFICESNVPIGYILHKFISDEQCNVSMLNDLKIRQM